MRSEPALPAPRGTRWVGPVGPVCRGLPASKEATHPSPSGPQWPRKGYPLAWNDSNHRVAPGRAWRLSGITNWRKHIGCRKPAAVPGRDTWALLSCQALSKASHKKLIPTNLDCH